MSSPTQPTKPGLLAREPVLSAATVLGVLGSLLAFATARGWITETQASVATQVGAAVLPILLSLIAGAIARAKVTPVKAPAPGVDPKTPVTSPVWEAPKTADPKPEPAPEPTSEPAPVPEVPVAPGVDALAAMQAAHPVPGGQPPPPQEPANGA